MQKTGGHDGAPGQSGRDAGGPALLRWEAGQTLRLALPLVVAQLAFIAIGATDMVMIGWLGPDQLAAGAIGNNIFFPSYLFCMGIIVAVAPIVAQALGARQYRAVRRSVRQGFWVAILLGLAFSVVLWQGEAILLLLGQEPVTAARAGSYMRAAVGGFTFSLCFVVLRSLLTAHSRPRAVVAAGVAGALLNLAGNWLLMFGSFGLPALGIVGAGLSTAFANIAMFLGLLVFVLRDRRFRRYAILARFWRADWPRFFEILRIGFPIGLAILAESGLFAAAGVMMGWIGTAELAAHGIAMQCSAVAFMLPLGIAQAATVRVGYAAGAGRFDEIGRAGWVALAIGAGFSCLSAGAFLLIPEALADVFLDLSRPDSRAVMLLTASYLGIAALFQLMDGAQVVAAGALRGLKDTRVPSLIAVIGYWPIGFVAAYLLAFHGGLEGQGIWLGLASGLTVVAVLLVRRFHSRSRWLQAGVPAPAGAT
ncbi:MAG: MATE family efflux transporter [Kiloniellales bacterium]